MKRVNCLGIFKKHKTEIVERTVPTHIGIILDGNGRWAKKRKLPRMAGHVAGSNNFKTIARYCNKIGVRYLTAYAFSTENWKRPKDEVDNIMNLLRSYLKDVDNFKGENIKLRFIGNREPLADDIKELMKSAEKDSENATGLTVNLAINYGGRDEIVTAAKRIAEKCRDGELKPSDITEVTFKNYLYTAGQPDPDFIIRPSGEQRLSNFLVWQSAYSEFWFSNVLWPDFKPKHLDMAIEEFNHRNRRFGGVTSEVKK